MLGGRRSFWLPVVAALMVLSKQAFPNSFQNKSCFTQNASYETLFLLYFSDFPT